MRRLRPGHFHSCAFNWPFWLLIAAWLCANIPATPTLHAFLWMKGAGHFSHYAELRQNVASLLSGQPPAESPRQFAAKTAERSLPPALPANAVVKKVDLAQADGIVQVVAPPQSASRPLFSVRKADEPVREAPFLPPRHVGQA